jgi:general secretion pathway protein F/type IV pilus assembly protein PilC
MNHFRYKLITSTGEIYSGIIKLPHEDPVSAISHLEKSGSTVLFVKKLDRLSTYLQALAKFRLKKKGTRKDQIELLNNLAMMLHSGITLTAALEEAAAAAEKSEIAEDLDNLVIDIQGGASFSEAAARYRHLFPQIALYLIRIGEETGKLDEMLRNAADHLKKLQEIANDTKQALLYPSFIFFMLGAAFLFWAYYVAPKIFELFQEMDVSLPTLTVAVIQISNFLQNYIVHLFLGITLVVIVLYFARRGISGFRKQTDALLLKLPVIGSIIKASLLAFISEYFSLMMQAGIDVMNLMDILKNSIKNQIYREKLTSIRESLTRGEGIADAFAGVEVFPRYVTRMIGVGEKSGTLPEQLAYIAEEYRSKLSVLVATIGKSIEPAVLVVAGILFAVLIGGLLLPIYDLVGQVNV